MKLANFRALDPQYTQQGKKGLSRGGRLDAVIWSELSDRPQEIAAIAAAIRANASAGAAGGAVPDFVSEATEGGLLTRVHVERERNAKIVAAKKAHVLQALGCLACETCGFDFGKKYGARGAGFIEAHHIQPLHTLLPGTKTRLEDLALLCSNCHRMIHARTPGLTLAQLREIIAGSRG